MNSIGPQMNPLSSQFTQKALRVASAQVSTVKNQKETEQKDETKDTNEDRVMLGQQHTPAKGMKAAMHAGLLSEMKEKEKKKEKTALGESSMFGGEEVEGEKKGSFFSPVREDEKVAKTDELDAKFQALSVMNRDPEEIRGDVPLGFFTAAQKIVEGQIQKTGPSDALKNLKPVEGTAMIEIQPAKFHDIMGIHDTNNKPLTMDMGTGVA